MPGGSAVLRKARPEIVIEIRWCPAHKGIAGNEKVDEWAKQAAEEPDAHGVKWLSFADRYVWETAHAPTQIPWEYQEGDLGEEVG
jgi:ribonuclease HI